MCVCIYVYRPYLKPIIPLVSSLKRRVETPKFKVSSANWRLAGHGWLVAATTDRRRSRIPPGKCWWAKMVAGFWWLRPRSFVGLFQEYIYICIYLNSRYFQVVLRRLLGGKEVWFLCLFLNPCSSFCTHKTNMICCVSSRFNFFSSSRPQRCCHSQAAKCWPHRYIRTIPSIHVFTNNQEFHCEILTSEVTENPPFPYPPTTLSHPTTSMKKQLPATYPTWPDVPSH